MSLSPNCFVEKSYTCSRRGKPGLSGTGRNDANHRLPSHPPAPIGLGPGDLTKVLKNKMKSERKGTKAHTLHFVLGP